jgi:outer membrane lipoprotein SlyB
MNLQELIAVLAAVVWGILWGQFAAEYGRGAAVAATLIGGVAGMMVGWGFIENLQRMPSRYALLNAVGSVVVFLGLLLLPLVVRA